MVHYISTVKEMVGRIWQWVSIGIGIGTLFHGFVPEDCVHVYLLNRFPGMANSRHSASNNLTAATASSPYLDGEVKASISVPNFYDNFAMKQNHIINDERNEKLIAALNSLFENSNDRW